MTYIGESTTCTWISQTMEIGDMWKVLEKAIGESMSGRNIWYGLKFDIANVICKRGHCEVNKRQ